MFPRLARLPALRTTRHARPPTELPLEEDTTVMESCIDYVPQQQESTESDSDSMPPLDEDDERNYAQ
jgi:hypothetical protein